MFNIETESFLFDLYYGGKSAVETLEDGDVTPTEEKLLPVTGNSGVQEYIRQDLVSRNARRAMLFNGLPEMKINNIQIEDINITAQYGAELSNSKDIVFKNVHIVPQNGSALILKDVENFISENFTYPSGLENQLT